ncbi:MULTISPECIES: PEP/pyruvate-binding domain-containing protein [unclassified Luteococcus]|uniref:PEP/pyruvate-binding domain-containing protein n=1 Tax=unclassified Luteococcus TaxID=2639923 RepID=UPI00313C9D15
MGMISWLDQAASRDLLGGKGGNLSELLRAGFPVPNGFVVTTAGYRHYLTSNGLEEELQARLAAGDQAGIAELFEAPLPPDLADELVRAWRDLGGAPVAVRSSSTAEDLGEASFAGQQDSFLNVHGEQELCDAVRRCFASLWNQRAIAYRGRRGVDQARTSLAVVVQLMVEAEVAGVMFTANPLNGRHDETLITATFGLGEQTMQGGEADTVVVRAGAVAERTVSDKRFRIQSAPDGQGTVDVGVDESHRRDDTLDDVHAVELAALGARVAEHFGRPQDVEWVLTDDVLVLVQARAITALVQTVGDIPDDWTVPDDKAMYVRNALTDHLPDPLSPLFADMVRPAVASSVRTALVTHLDQDVLRPGEVDFPTVNGYPYYYYSREAMLRLLKQSPLGIAVLGGRSQFDGDALWQNAHPAYLEAVGQWAERDLEHLASWEILEGVETLLQAGCDYYAAVQALVPLAASPELPFTRLYTGLAKQAKGPDASVFLQGFDSRPVQAERSVWQLAQWVRSQPELADALLSGRDLTGVPGAEDFRARLGAHLARFGHLVHDLDFMAPTPADDPRPVLERLRHHLSGQGHDPDELLDQQTARREEAETALFERLDPARKAILQPLLSRAQQVGPARENALADLGLAWPVMRRMLRILGQRLTDIGVLAVPDEIFWLRHDELVELCDHLDAFGGPRESLAQVVEQRRITWRGQRAANPPQLLPHNAWYKMFHRLVPAMESHQQGPVIKGLGVSEGRITGPARLIRGPEDFGQMLPGEVLVSPITTPAWTPLFAMAAAVVTDVGGPLSHTSIVAREYQIPAVLGTGIATRRIHTGMLVTVDADRGTITLPEGEAPVETGFKPKVPYKFAMGAAAAAALVLKKVL